MRTVGAVGNDGPVDTAGGTVAVVGIGADGWAGLAEPGRAAVRAAEVLLGGPRQLELVAGHTKADARPWPSPMLPALPGLFGELAGRRVCVLASGDPLFHGIGATLARVLGPERLHVVPHPSSVSLACARLGWPVDGVEVISAVARPLARVRRVLAPGARLLVLSEDDATPGMLAALLTDAGYGGSVMTVLAQLGGSRGAPRRRPARGWAHPPGDPPERRRRLLRRGCGGAGPGRGARSARRRLRPRRAAHQARGPRRHARPSRSAARRAAVGRRRGQRVDRDRVAARAPHVPGGGRRERRGAGRPDRGERRGARCAVPAGGAGPGTGGAGRAARPGRGVHRRRDHEPGSARCLLGGAAAGRSAGGERRHAGGRGGARRCPRPARR